MEKLKVLMSLYVVLLLTGCVSSLTESTLSPSPTSLPTTSTAQPTPFLLEPSVPTISLPLGKVLTYQCLEVVPHLPPDLQPLGMLVIEEKHPFLLELETGVKIALNDSKGGFSASPDGKWLASFYVDDNIRLWLSVEAASGKQEKLIPWNDDWFLLGGWLDDEHVWISHSKEPLLTVVNPFSGEQQELVPDFPGLETVAQLGEHFTLGASTVLYNSSLNLAVYPRLESDGYAYVVLWDRQANRVLAKIKDVSKSFSYRPLWSLDQKEIYVAVADLWNKPDDLIHDFFGLSQDGQVRQLTDFGASFAATSIGGSSLSPDGKKIAFWLKLRPSLYEEQQLAVLDLETQQVTNYCVPGSYQGDAPSPLWSLDGRYLTVQNQYKPNAGWVILIDIQQGWATQVAELIPNGWPAGWLVHTSR
jgi:hypothetical protein